MPKITQSSIIFLLQWTFTAGAGGSRPGACKNDVQCAAKAARYVCVSVQTTRTGTRNVKQCLPHWNEGDVCTGKTPGRCPSFAKWSNAYKPISPTCAYILPTSPCNTKDGQTTAKGVDCIYVPDQSGEDVGVIYGCVDYSIRDERLLFEKSSKADKLASLMDYSKIIKDNCLNPSAPDLVCSGRGTCMPDYAMSMNYACGCNTGYKGRYCEKIDSNRCTNEAQCAAGTCNLNKQECECPKGTTGNQCAYCDVSSSNACGGNGKCVAPPTTSSTSKTQLGSRLLQQARYSNSHDEKSDTYSATPFYSPRFERSSPSSETNLLINVTPIGPQYRDSESPNVAQDSLLDSESPFSEQNARKDSQLSGQGTSSNVQKLSGSSDLDKKITSKRAATSDATNPNGDTNSQGYSNQSAVTKSRTVASDTDAGSQWSSRYTVDTKPQFSGTRNAGTCQCNEGWSGTHCDRSTADDISEGERSLASRYDTFMTSFAICFLLSALFLT